MSYILAHANGLAVDVIFIALAAAIFSVSRSAAAGLALAYYSIALVFGHFGLAYFEYAHELTLDYHLSMAGLVLAFFIAILVKSNGYGLLKCALGLNFLLHSVLMIKEPAYQLDLISYNTHTVIYDSYQPARIVIVSLQILGLINGGQHGGRNHFNTRIRAYVRRTFDDFRFHSLRTLRAKRQ